MAKKKAAGKRPASKPAARKSTRKSRTKKVAKAAKSRPAQARPKAAAKPARVPQVAVAPPVPPRPQLCWTDIRSLGVEGKGWRDTESFFDRLPARAKGVVRPPVWDLSQRSAGLCVRFVADATAIWARWTLRRPNLAMSHMPASGVSGLDLYVHDGGQWRWLGVGRPEKVPTNELALVQDLDGRRRQYLLYLPLYNGVTGVEIGLPPGATPQPAPPAAGKPIVFYGTSIVQGGVASRPGMAYPAILGRRLGRGVVNLGFSGNGQMEPELADLLAELDPCAYVLDALPNMAPAMVAERLAPFVRTLRRGRPRTPIVLVENITYTNAAYVEPRRQRCLASNQELRRAHRQLLQEGVGGLHVMAGDVLLGFDGEATVDGTHATDLGFLRMADALTPLLRPLV